MHNISLTISDKETPIVVFFGGRASGKTLALIRLTRFLSIAGYKAITVNDLFSKEDIYYKHLCSKFHEMLFGDDRVFREVKRGFMMVKILNPEAQPVCQILKAPGEYYFNETSNLNLNFPRYINEISTTNRKVWVFFVEQGWGQNQVERNLYAKTICNMQKLVSPNDKVVFLFAKADIQHEQYDRHGKPKKKIFFNQIKNEYPDIFTNYKNTGLRKLLFGEYNCETICFSAGIFSMRDGRAVWFHSSNWYCSELWTAIQKLIR